MPYRSNSDLPPGVRGHLPAHAQDIYRAAFNNAWGRYGEASARRAAWAAVKRKYRKEGGSWTEKEGSGV